MIIKCNREGLRYKRFNNPEFDIVFSKEKPAAEVTDEVGEFLLLHFPNDFSQGSKEDLPAIVESKSEFDLNNDGVVDKKDFTIASNTLKKARKLKIKEE